MIFINDGSNDNTLNVLIEQKEYFTQIRVLDLSRNFGKEAALTAGLKACLGELIIPIDIDLQDPPSLIFEFIKKWEEGFEIVLAKRASRKHDTIYKRITALLFYNIYNVSSHKRIISNVGDYRLMTRKVVDSINQLNERNRFMKGILSWVGYENKTTVIEFQRDERASGETTLNTRKLIFLAWEGITSFGILPLRVMSCIGFIVFVTSGVYFLIVLFRTLYYGNPVMGYPTIVCLILISLGLQLISIGIVGEYVGKIYIETKQRPIYIIHKEY